MANMIVMTTSHQHYSRWAKHHQQVWSISSRDSYHHLSDKILPLLLQRMLPSQEQQFHHLEGADAVDNIVVVVMVADDGSEQMVATTGHPLAETRSQQGADQQSALSRMGTASLLQRRTTRQR